MAAKFLSKNISCRCQRTRVVAASVAQPSTPCPPWTKPEVNIFMTLSNIFNKNFPSVDDSQTSDSSSSEFYNNYSCSIRRSATLYAANNSLQRNVNPTSKTATLNTRHYNRNLARTHHQGSSYSSATLSRLPRTSPTKYNYSSATLGRTPRHWSRDTSNNNLAEEYPGHSSETELYFPQRHGRKVKRTESFV